jgi:predicted AAA+ superfamily ATPase
MLPLTVRSPKLGRLMEQHGYFVIHAPRQTGKTTVVALAQELTTNRLQSPPFRIIPQTIYDSSPSRAQTIQL